MQKDPLNEYKREAFIMFEDATTMRQTVTMALSHVELRQPDEDPTLQKQRQLAKCREMRLSRGSGKKYKHCCGKLKEKRPEGAKS